MQHASSSSSKEFLNQAGDPHSTPFDYVIVGSGAGGGPLAARLARAGKRVLVLEAGDDPALQPTQSGDSVGATRLDPKDLREVSQVPCYHAAATEDPQMSWGFSVRHYSDDQRQRRDQKYAAQHDPSSSGGIGKGGVFYPRCAALGGCTAHHAMIIVGPNDRDWNEIAELTGDDSWRAERMQGYFTRVEKCLYRTIYQRFFRRLFGWIYEFLYWLVGLINPRAVQDPGGHGFNGWQPTSFINPDLVVKIEKSDRSFRRVIVDAVASILLGGKGTIRILERALTQLRLVEFLDPNDRNTRTEKPEGLAFIPLGTDGVRRVGVRELLLNTCEICPDRLVIKTGVQATRILFSKTLGSKAPQAIGVEVAAGQHLYDASPLAGNDSKAVARERYFARHEVIVCGGTFNTPQLLMLSGIGDTDQLREHGITELYGADGTKVAPAIHLPGVGFNLQDRYEISVVSALQKDFSTLQGVSFIPGDKNDPAREEWLTKGTGLYTTNGGTLAIFVRSPAASHAEPDLFLFGVPAAVRGYYWGWSKEFLFRTKGAGKEQRNLWSWIILKAYTQNDVGSVRLRSGSPFQQPEINFAFFGDGTGKSDEDIQALLHAVELVRRINKQPGFPFEEEIQPGPGLGDHSAALEDWMRNEAWGHHACGTCRIGSDPWRDDVDKLDDKNAVLDSKFRVHGVRGLRVVDASVFPKIPGYFIVAPIFMISEKAADTILADSQLYPDLLQSKEAAAIERRRKGVTAGSTESGACIEASIGSRPPAEKERLPTDTVGLALSGHGLRSAIFCLGVLQALARKDKLRFVDLLSTVSGGGYIGGFLGRLYTRLTKSVADKAGRVQDILKAASSAEIGWLRSNASYIAGAGLSDLRQKLAVYWRNLFAVHLVIGALAFVLFGSLRWLADILGMRPGSIGRVLPGFAVSPWWWLPLALFALTVLPGSLGFWLAPRPGTRVPHPFYSVLVWLTLLGGAVAACTLPAGLPWAGSAIAVLVVAYLWQEAAQWGLPLGIRRLDVGVLVGNRLTRALGEALLIFAGAVLWVLLDTLARAAASHGLSQALAAVVITLAPFLPVLTVIAEKLTDTPDAWKTGRTVSLLPQWTAALLAFSLGGFLLLVVDVVAHQAFNAGRSVGGWATLVALAFSLAIGRAFGFLNSSSLYAPYAARLTRTFLGASNAERIYGTGTSVPTDVNVAHSKDDLPYHHYHPELNGGPLHLINVYVNETADPASERDVRERSGLSMCVGPTGVSVGRRFHALWVDAETTDATILGRVLSWLGKYSFLEPGEKTALQALAASEDPTGFHVFGRRDGRRAAVESLRLGQWIAISGAALSTRLGGSTALPMAILLGLANFRLGYWWNSGISAGDRPGRYPDSLWRRIKLLPAKLSRTQSMILDEWRAYYSGPSRRFWYLSDGGSFEASAVYELVRRRVPFIIAVEADEDPTGRFGDLGLLTRLIRFDFRAEIVWLDPTEARKNGFEGWAALEATTAPQAIPNWIKDWLDPDSIGQREAIGRRGTYHAAMAKISYADAAEQTSWLLLLKASLTGDEPVDVRQYSIRDPAFPDQPTTDRLFDDAQWESYRALGDHIGATLLASPNNPPNGR